MTRVRPTDPWWRSAVFYQVYLRSFADSNDDGVGDIPGLIARLPHLLDLGVDAVWVSPWYRSPMHDGGYDITDYRDIDPLFGTKPDAVELITRCHRHGLRVVIDLVANHTSAEHPWFLAALASPPGSSARRRYHFRPGRGAHGQHPPNNWISAFGGPAWTRTTEPDGTPGEWYLHLFSAQQPDLNWDCRDVAEEFDAIIRHWLDLGVDGIRVDAASALVKHHDLPTADIDTSKGFTPRAWPLTPFWDVDGVHDILRRWRAIVDEYPGDRCLIGEVVVASPDRLATYLRDDELHSAFAFDLLHAAWDATAIRTAIDRSLQTVDQGATRGATLTWVLSNHDEIRHATRYAFVKADTAGPTVDPDIGLARARAALLLILALPGSACLYQGDELGLPEVLDIPAELRRDPTFERTGGAIPGRDGSRVPLPWAGTHPPFNFTRSEPWLPQPQSWAQLTAAAQKDQPGSTLNLYRGALQLRRQLIGTSCTPLTWRESPPGTLSFDRPYALTCIVNLTANPTPLDTPPLLISSEQSNPTELPPNSAAWLGWNPAHDAEGVPVETSRP